MTFSEIRPRHVLCILGKPGHFVDLCDAVHSAIDDFAADFRIDREFSQDRADDRMPTSFDISWDRVKAPAWTELDETAVQGHGCVIYVLGPPMDNDTTIETSAIALRLVAYALKNGAVAAKGESAGVAHGTYRWQDLAREAAQAGERPDLARVCRLAFAKRPLDDGDFLSSVGFHLVGLPEVLIPKGFSTDELSITAAIDRFADDMLYHGVNASVAKAGATLQAADFYDEDDFKYNPYGAVYLPPA